jgi:LacI family transcriptional regulator
MAVSLKDISEHLDLSICVVSQVLNDHPRARSLRPETRERVLAAARELGYCKNEMAASMAKKHSNVLAFVTGDMGSVEYTGRIQNGVLEAASSCNYLVMLHRLNDFSPAETAQKILGWRAAGVVFHVAELEDISQITPVLDRNHIPWGTVNLSNPEGIGVTSDDSAATESLVALFHKKGCRHVAFLSQGGEKVEFCQTRTAGYLAGMKKYYPEKAPLILNSGEPSELFRLFEENFADAVICVSDHLAASLVNAAASRGIGIPQKLSVAGFGNSVISEYANPPLTTVAQDFEDMGTQTVRQLVHVIEKRKAKKDFCRLLPAKIIERDSTLFRRDK